MTLEDDGVMRFPDAPTERGVKHLEGLARCVQEGYEAWAVFVIQTEDVRTHPAFADAMRQAAQAGVHLLALDCHTEPDRLEIRRPVEIRLR